MGRPSIGEIDLGFGETQAEKLGKLTVLNEDSEKTIYNLIFATNENNDKDKTKDTLPTSQ